MSCIKKWYTEFYLYANYNVFVFVLHLSCWKHNIKRTEQCSLDTLPTGFAFCSLFFLTRLRLVWEFKFSCVSTLLLGQRERERVCLPLCLWYASLRLQKTNWESVVWSRKVVHNSPMMQNGFPKTEKIHYLHFYCSQRALQMSEMTNTVHFLPLRH